MGFSQKKRRALREKKRIALEQSKPILSNLPLELLVAVLSFLLEEDVPFFALTCTSFLKAFYCSGRKIVFKNYYNVSSLSRIAQLPESWTPSLITRLVICRGEINLLNEMRHCHKYHFRELRNHSLSVSDLATALHEGHVHMAEYIMKYVRICYCKVEDVGNYEVLCRDRVYHPDGCLLSIEMIKYIFSGNKVLSLDFLKNKALHIPSISDELFNYLIQTTSYDSIRWLLQNYRQNIRYHFTSVEMAIKSMDYEMYLIISSEFNIIGDLSDSIECKNVAVITYQLRVICERNPIVRFTPYFRHIQSNIDKMIDLFIQLDDSEGMKLLWRTGAYFNIRHNIFICLIHDHPRCFKYLLDKYINGADDEEYDQFIQDIQTCSAPRERLDKYMYMIECCKRSQMYI
tara:strand:- start:859 stop:2064 length:1206 start_codon:yes stop_codon:yes gene_type:complete